MMCWDERLKKVVRGRFCAGRLVAGGDWRRSVRFVGLRVERLIAAKLGTDAGCCLEGEGGGRNSPANGLRKKGDGTGFRSGF